jgi:hypothetical protein
MILPRSRSHSSAAQNGILGCKYKPAQQPLGVFEKLDILFMGVY